MITLALTLALALAPPSPRAAVPSQHREGGGEALLREAKGLRYAQRWFEAAALYRRFLAENPSSPRVPDGRFWLAATLESDQRWDEAAEAYTDFLERHPDQRILVKEAQLNRIRCWGVRQGQSPRATPGLLAALGDPALEVQVAAALQLAKVRDIRAVPGLQKGLAGSCSSQACGLALVSLGVKPAAVPTIQARFLVIRIQEAGKKEAVTIRLALALARALGSYLSDAQIRQAQAKGVDLDSLTEQAATLPKGSVLLSVEDGKSTVRVTVE